MIKYFNSLGWMALLWSILLISCKREPEPEPESKLVASAGADQTVGVNTLVQLDGSASQDGKGKSFTYAWRFQTKPSGSQASLSQATAARPTFTPDQAGSYVIELKIANARGQATDVVTITVMGNDPGGPTVGIINQDITQDRQLTDIFTDPAAVDYLVTADVKVSARLSLSPGVVVAFEADKSLTILSQGTLIAKGTEAKPIVFTGKSPQKGYWKGLIMYSNNQLNELDYVTVAYGGSSSIPDIPVDLKANLVLTATSSSAAALKITNSRISDSGGFGLFVHGHSQLSSFSDNAFLNNAGAAAFVPANQVHKLDAFSLFTGNNGVNGVQTGGTLQQTGEVAWPVFADGSPYLVGSDLTLASGLKLSAGNVLKFLAGVGLMVESTGYLEAVGSSGKPVVFTAASQTQNGHWGGILIQSASDRNQLHYSQISWAGGKDLPGFTGMRTHIAVNTVGKLSLQQSLIEQGPGWGVVAYKNLGARLNPDAATANQFRNLAAGTLKLSSVVETTSLAGEWFDAWSFQRNYALTENFYNRTTRQWFGGAANPWKMNPPGGFGLKIADDGSYRWTIAEHGPPAGCGNSYSAEYILGIISATAHEITFTESYWRSKFYNPCDESQSVDLEVTPGGMSLRYEIYQETVNKGETRWVLKLINPDNSFFTYYRK